MQERSRSLLRDVVTAAELILGHTASRSLDYYLRDPWFRSAVERNFEIIGEAIRKLERIDPATVTAIPHYREIIDFRNRIVHGYDDLDHARVWRYAQQELPALRQSIIALLEPHDETTDEELRP